MAEDKTKKPEELQDEQLKEELLDEVNGGAQSTPPEWFMKDE